MSASSIATASAGRFGHAFWERMWRSAGIQSAGLFIIAYLVYGAPPPIGASHEELAAYYAGGRFGIPLAAALCGLAVLNLMWFAAAIRTTLADAGRDGWGSAATAASAAVGAMFILLITLCAALAYSLAGSGDSALASGLNDIMWAGFVLSSFPRAMLIMSGSLGLWRAGLISNGLFAAGVAAIVLVLAGGTTWLSGGFWAPDGAYSRVVSPIICLVWVAAASGILLSRVPASRSGW
jgi:hypothetical protein